MTVTAKQVREALGVAVDTLGKTKSGNYVARRGFFYRHGMSSSEFTRRVVSALFDELGVNATVVNSGEHYAAFRGGATVAKSSHWYVEFTV